MITKIANAEYDKQTAQVFILKPQSEFHIEIKVPAKRKRPQLSAVAVAGKQVAVKGNLRGNIQGCALEKLAIETDNRDKGDIAETGNKRKPHAD